MLKIMISFSESFQSVKVQLKRQGNFFKNTNSETVLLNRQNTLEPGYKCQGCQVISNLIYKALRSSQMIPSLQTNLYWDGLASMNQFKYLVSGSVFQIVFPVILQFVAFI